MRETSGSSSSTRPPSTATRILATSQLFMAPSGGVLSGDLAPQDQIRNETLAAFNIVTDCHVLLLAAKDVAHPRQPRSIELNLCVIRYSKRKATLKLLRSRDYSIAHNLLSLSYFIIANCHVMPRSVEGCCPATRFKAQGPFCTLWCLLGKLNCGMDGNSWTKYHVCVLFGLHDVIISYYYNRHLPFSLVSERKPIHPIFPRRNLTHCQLSIDRGRRFSVD